MAGEAAAPVREVDHRQHHGRGGGEHQRDQREVEAGEANRRQADEHADRHHDRSVDDQQQGNGIEVAYARRVPTQQPIERRAT